MRVKSVVIVCAGGFGREMLETFEDLCCLAPLRLAYERGELSNRRIGATAGGL